MKKPGEWIGLAVAIALFGGLVLMGAMEGEVPFALAVIVLILASAVLSVGLVALGVKVGLRDAGVVGVAPAPSEPHEGREESPEDEVNDPHEVAEQVQQVLAEGPATNQQLYAFTGLKERELRAALDLLSQRGAVERSGPRWQLPGTPSPPTRRDSEPRHISRPSPPKSGEANPSPAPSTDAPKLLVGLVIATALLFIVFVVLAIGIVTGGP